MDSTHKLLTLCSVLLGAVSVSAADIGQWDFETGDLSANASATLGPLQYADGPGGATQGATSFGTTTSFGIPDINGTPAKVMRFPAATSPLGYLIPTPTTPNGGDVPTLVGDFTLILDVLYPGGSQGKFRPLIQPDPGSDGVLSYLAISAGNALGATNNGSNLPSGFGGQIASNTWYRVGVVVNTSGDEIDAYINGVLVLSLNGLGGSDNSYALDTASVALLLSNFDANTAAGYVNSIQLRDVALSPGQMRALGGPSASGIPITIPPIPSFIASRSPGLDAAGVGPTPTIHVVIDQGGKVVSKNSVKLSLDGNQVAATAAGPANNQITVDFATTNILDPSSVHTISLVYSDNAIGLQTNTWSFTVASYQNVTLPAPFYLENFDGVAEGALPAGWTVTNATTVEHAVLDLCDPQSNSYLDWVVINTNRLCAGGPCAGLECDTLDHSPVVLNGVVLASLASSNLFYAESDNRCNVCAGQLNVAFTADVSCAGRTNVFVVWKSLYKQNQNNIASVEYSIDHGATWLPVIYYLDDERGAADIIRTNGVIDVAATFNTARPDQYGGQAYGAFIGAPVSADLIPYIAGRINDDNDVGTTGLYGSRRIEVVRLAQADGQQSVRFRLMQAGVWSWFFGVDDFGLYEINSPVILTQPASQSIEAADPVTFSLVVNGKGPFTYQWQYNGTNIPGATDSSYNINVVSPNDAGKYRVIVSNSYGTATSSPAQLTVTTLRLSLRPPVVNGSTLTLNWSGGTPPYLVEKKLDLGNPDWMSVLTTANQAATFPLLGNMFFRVSNRASTTVTMFLANMNGANERPTPIVTPGSGVGIFSLEGNTLSYCFTYKNLSSAAFLAHIHGPASTSGSANPLYPLPGVAGTAGTVAGAVVLSDADKTSLLSGLLYVNIHTVNHTEGEIRGQLGP